jgi:hypothetical protein
MKEFNQQFSTLHLREEFDPNISFTINDPEVDRIFGNLIDQKRIVNLAPEDAEFKTLSDKDWNILQLTFEDDLIVQNKGTEFIDSVHQINEEGSVTGGGEAFLPGLDVPEKVYKAGYTKKVKEAKDVEPKLAAGKSKNNMPGWEDAPSIPNRPSKGGFIYKQLFEALKEPLQEGIKTDITRRSKLQQFNEAAKLANKKLSEVNAILEYAAKLKVELNEAGNAPSTRLMEKIKVSVIEAYKKIKEL